MFDRIFPHIWLEAPRDIREHLAEVFGVQQTGPTEIKDDRVVSDGRTIEDLAVITAERMAEYVGSVEPFPRLWELTLAKARAELNPPVAIIGNGPAEEEKPHVQKKKGKQE